MGTSNAPKLWSLLLEKWGGLNDRNEYGETPLHEAVSRHNASAVKVSALERRRCLGEDQEGRDGPRPGESIREKTGAFALVVFACVALERAPEFAPRLCGSAQGTRCGIGDLRWTPSL